MMIVYFYTLGCKVNQYETQAMMHLLEQDGYTVAEYTVGQEDVGDSAVVVNSCTVTGESDRKLRQLLRRLRRDNPNAVLILTGCMPQAFPDVAAAYEQVDIVLGNAERKTIGEQLSRYLTQSCRIVDIPAHDTAYEPLHIETFEGRTRAFVKIEDGCNRFCTYCIIPYARGRVRSRPLDDLRGELEKLARNGYREVVLVGINLTAYGQDLGLNICDAVECACAVEGIERVRLGSLEPDHMTDEIIERLTTYEKLCPQFHLALQSGCDATLKRMNRHYDTAHFRHVCERLRERFPHCAITTDVMVGFPNETEEEFERSLAFVNEMAFSRLHCFPYSRREGTVAAKASGQIPTAEKSRRNRLMIAAGEKMCAAYAETFVGKAVTVFLETCRDDGGCEGYTDTYVPVVVYGGEPNTVVTVTVKSAKDGVCYAKQ